MRTELITQGMLGKVTSFPYSCINGVCRGPCGNNSTNCTAPYSPTAFSVTLSWKENRLLWFRQMWFIHFSEAYCTKKKKKSVASQGNGGYLCRSQRKGYGCILKGVKLMETLLFSIIKYMYGGRLPVVSGAFPQVITAHQRRRACSTLMGFCHTIIFLPSHLPCVFHRGLQRLGHSRCPAHRQQNFPIMLILQVIVNAQAVLEHSCPQDLL